MKYRRRSWWKKCKESIASFLTAKRNEEEKSDKRPRMRQVLGKSGRLFFLLVGVFGTGLAFASMLQQKDCRKERRLMERWQQRRFQAKEGRWVEETTQKWKQPLGEDRTDMKRGKTFKVHLAEWCSVEYREKAHEKMRYLL